MNKVLQNLDSVKQQISKYELQYHREPGSVKLIAVSKKHALEKVQAAISAGQKSFAENYLQEALTKIQTLASENLDWHFIGAIQSNKTKIIAENFSWVHSVSQLKIAERLSAHRPENLAPLNILIQVNISGEASKSGVSLNQIEALAFAISKLSKLKLRGLMTMLAPDIAFQKQRDGFSQLYQAKKVLETTGLTLDTLSMGMSGDMEAAIAEGSTMVRIGTAIFGQREQ